MKNSMGGFITAPWLLVGLLLVWPASAEQVQPTRGLKEFDVRTLGAMGDGVHLDTAAIQRALDACHDRGGGVVVVPPGTYTVGTLRLRSHVTLRLLKGAVIQGSYDLADYATDIRGAIEAPAFDKVLIYAEDATNLTFEGDGVVDGRGTRERFPEREAAGGALRDRPMLMRLVNCDSVRFTGLTFVNPASWGLHLVECRNVRFDGIEIKSQNNNINNDGIDLDSCSDVVIENCRIISGDDAICLKSTTIQPCSNIVVRNCIISSHTAGLKLGTSSLGGFVKIQVSDTRFFDCPMGVVKLLLVDGGRMEDIELSNLVMENVGGPVFIRLGNRGRRYDRPTEQVYERTAQPEGMPVGRICGVTIRDVQADVTGPDLDRQGIMITGIPGHRIENLTLENVHIRFAGPPVEHPVRREVPEDAARYPEQFFFGVLPSWGLFLRHVEGVVLNEVVLERRGADVRSPIVLHDVASIEVNGLYLQGATAGVSAATTSR